MTSLDPSDRCTAAQYLSRGRGSTFPDQFYSRLRPLTDLLQAESAPRGSDAVIYRFSSVQLLLLQGLMCSVYSVQLLLFVQGLLCSVYSVQLLLFVQGLLCSVYSVQLLFVQGLLFSVYSVQLLLLQGFCVLHSVQCVQCIGQAVRCMLYGVGCTVYCMNGVYCTVYCMNGVVCKCILYTTITYLTPSSPLFLTTLSSQPIHHLRRLHNHSLYNPLSHFS